jgi:hypothetical protein
VKSNHFRKLAAVGLLAIFLLPLAVEGRFLSVDPKASKYPSISPYAYAVNNPIRMVDPNGEDAVDFVVGMGQGAWGEAKATGVGFYELGKGLATEPGQTLSDIGDGISFAIGHPGEVWEQVSSHVSQTWQSGDQGKGQIVGEIGLGIVTAVVGTKGADKFEKVSKVSKLKGLANPFKGKTAGKIDNMFKKAGFSTRGPDPLSGKGGYVNPKTGRSYHIDPGKPGVEKPHVDVNRKTNQGTSDLPKKKLPTDE